MLVLLIVLIAVAVVLLGTGAFFLYERRGGKAPRADAPAPSRPPTATTTATAPRTGDALDELAADELERGADVDAVIAELEASLAVDEALAEADTVAPEEVITRPSFKDRLAKARGAFAGYLQSVRSRSGIGPETWDDLEEALLLADVGVGPTQQLLDTMRARVKNDGLKDPEQLLDAMKAEVKTRLSGFDRSLATSEQPPTIWLFVGVNGVGKTTTIGKLARREVDRGQRVVLAAGDTFRAAAAEQLELWAQRAGAELVRGQEGGDPAAIIFDAVERAAARHADLVMADTAGRLHTKVNLMEELRKVRRVAEKGSGRVSEVLLVLDATTGQNGLTQAKQFTEAVDLTGVVLTKLDGSAKGGIVLAIQQELGIPVKLVGLGEGVGDLVEFDPEEFTEALFS